MNYSWELPFGHHQGLLDKLTSGWTVSGVTTIQSGTPLTVTDPRTGTIFGSPSVGSSNGQGGLVATAQYAQGMSVANVRNPGSPQSHTVAGNPYLNPAAFLTPASAIVSEPTSSVLAANIPGCTALLCPGFNFGNSGLGIVRGPNQNNWDITLAKVTRVGGIHEDATLQFRTEFFNAFNHPQFSNPNGSTTGQVALNASNFGQIQSASVNPRLIQFALKYQF
jgi:hypothetical protein